MLAQSRNYEMAYLRTTSQQSYKAFPANLRLFPPVLHSIGNPKQIRGVSIVRGTEALSWHIVYRMSLHMILWCRCEHVFRHTQRYLDHQ